MNLFIAKLAYNISEAELKSLFEQYGTVISASIIFDKYDNRSKGFGFVEMDDDAQALKAIENLNETEFGGKTIVVKKARTKSIGNTFQTPRRG